MRALVAFSLLLPTVLTAGQGAPMEDGRAQLEQIRRNVAAQLAKSANYACVETLERAYYLTKTTEIACRQPAQKPSDKVYLQDRLRLDVAVSQHAEIYSWHGENKFSTTDIDAVVQSGPVSTGGFIGYLSNIFLRAGVIFHFVGKSSVGGVESYHFSYTVPLAASLYRILGKAGPVLVPFRGSFKASAAGLQLTEMIVIADDIPPQSNVCSVETNVQYQMARISGFDALIPASFNLKIGSQEKMYTESQAEYQGCREFRAESALRFDTSDVHGSGANGGATAGGPLPEGSLLRIGLKTEINEKASYAGDAVEGVLLRKVTVKGAEPIPAGAVVRGVITKLETHFEPEHATYLRIEFQQLTSGNKTYSLRAVHVAGEDQKLENRFLFGYRVSPEVSAELLSGSMIIPGQHFHLGSRYWGNWLTVRPIAPKPDK